MKWFPSSWNQKLANQTIIHSGTNLTSPLVSIIIPVYNGSSYLREAIGSALDQTYEHIEVIVVDDGSSDGGATAAIVSEYEGRVKFFTKPNGGVSSALNLGISEMKGKYFSWLSHDDAYYPDKIYRQVARAECYEKPVIIYSDYDVINETSRVIYSHSIVPIESRLVCADLIVRYPVFGCATLIPKSIFDAIGGFKEDLRTTQDYEFYFRAARDYDFIHLAACTARHRVHPDQGSQSLFEVHVKEREELYIKLLAELPDRMVRNQCASKINYIVLSAAVALSIKGVSGASRFAREMLVSRLRQDGVVGSIYSLLVDIFLRAVAGACSLARRINLTYVIRELNVKLKSYNSAGA